ncbi:hypothetical protein RTM1035_09728 [Roseovarius sp. TM1035]|nr:hypothetical protein RTM1035_09728 [Roseovarius sp. TM1035]
MGRQTPALIIVCKDCPQGMASVPFRFDRRSGEAVLQDGGNAIGPQALMLAIAVAI